MPVTGNLSLCHSYSYSTCGIVQYVGTYLMRSYLSFTVEYVSFRLYGTQHLRLRNKTPNTITNQTNVIFETHFSSLLNNFRNGVEILFCNFEVFKYITNSFFSFVARNRYRVKNYDRTATKYVQYNSPMS